MTSDLFASLPGGDRVALGPQAFVLRGFALDVADALLAAVAKLADDAPFRHLVTPGGHTMSVAMTNAGRVGWVSDRRGYRYDPIDPLSGRPWPALPPPLLNLAQRAASATGFGRYRPDACLINRYAPGTRLTLHQDRDEEDAVAPIVSVSLGMDATFLFGGFQRTDRAARIAVSHGDVAIWGGADRLRFHGVLPVRDAPHPQVGPWRINLTFRKVFAD